MKCINQSLKYDNTNKYTIYRLLKYYYNKKDKASFDEAINKYKFCITKRFKIIEGLQEISVNLEDFYEVKESIDELEELEDCNNETENIIDLRNSIVSLFTDYYYLAQNIEDLSSIYSEEMLNEILTVKIKKETLINNKVKFILDYENDKKSKLLDTQKEKITNIKIDILKTIENFLFKYLYTKEFDNFKKYQPISYSYNLTLFYNYIMYSLYELAIMPDDSGEKIIILKSKLFIYSTLIPFHNLLFDQFFDQK